jgi:hypothetical protein
VRKSVEVLSYLWVEYQYRHDMVWKLAFRITAVAAALLIAPFLADQSVPEAVRYGLAGLPFLAIVVIAGGLFTLQSELGRLDLIREAYRAAQKEVLGPYVSANKLELRRVKRHKPEKRDQPEGDRQRKEHLRDGSGDGSARSTSISAFACISSCCLSPRASTSSPLSAGGFPISSTRPGIRSRPRRAHLPGPDSHRQAHASLDFGSDHVTASPPNLWAHDGALMERGVATVAISGKSAGTVNRKNKRNPLPLAATACLRRSMVRRGSMAPCMTCASLAHKLAHGDENTCKSPHS